MLLGGAGAGGFGCGQENSVAPMWLTILAWCALAVAFVSTGWIGCDIVGRGYWQQMRVREAVWPVTALYFGPLAVWAYRRFGPPSSPRWRHRHRLSQPPDKPGWATTAVGVSHCGPAAHWVTSSPSSPCSVWPPRSRAKRCS
ncbi:MAG: hypothetical protein ABR528_14440, partial [Pseudonocardiaceae bacterium]